MSSIEKQAAVVEFLKDFPSEQWATLSAIWKGTSVDLRKDASLLSIVSNNSRLEHQETDDGEIVLRYKYHHSISSAAGIISALNNAPDGIPRSEIVSMYPDAPIDIFRMIKCGNVIGIYNQERRDMILYPRGAKFLSELSGIIHPIARQIAVETSDDLTIEIRRGDAIGLLPKSQLQYTSMNNHSYPSSLTSRMKWYRVNSNVNPLPSFTDFNSTNHNSAALTDFIDDDDDDDGPRKRRRPDDVTKAGKASIANPYANQPKSSQPRPSVASLVPMSVKNRYFYEFDGGHLPIDSYFLKNDDDDEDDCCFGFRYGCSDNIKQLWQSTRIKIPQNDNDINKLLVTNNLRSNVQVLLQPRLAARLESSRLNEERVEVKKSLELQEKDRRKMLRKWRNIRVTNTHLAGSGLQDILDQQVKKFA